MADEAKTKFEIVQNQPAPAAPSFDAAAYFKEALAMRRPLQPVIRKVDQVLEVRVERPPSDIWFQCNPDPKMMWDTYVLRDRDKKYYVVTEPMLTHPLLAGRTKPVRLVEAAIWPPSVPYLIPFHHIDPEREFPAHVTAWDGYEQAKSGVWTQLHWNGSSFTVSRAENNPHKPTFSGKPLEELLALGFKGRIITDVDHPYIKEALRGVVG